MGIKRQQIILREAKDILLSHCNFPSSVLEFSMHSVIWSFKQAVEVQILFDGGYGNSEREVACPGYNPVTSTPFVHAIYLHF
jgi:hypothetical protein